jgi:glycosyltransferase involved in cell wall biosynthesis
LLVIGSGPEQGAMEARVAREQIDDVHFLGALPAWADSAPYLYAADLMLMPGYLGLAVNHAFAFGLPVVSQASPDPAIRFHSPEVAYVLPGENGLLAPFGDPAALLAAVERVLADRARFSQNAYERNAQLMAADDGRGVAPLPACPRICMKPCCCYSAIGRHSRRSCCEMRCMSNCRSTAKRGSIRRI